MQNNVYGTGFEGKRPKAEIQTNVNVKINEYTSPDQGGVSLSPLSMDDLISEPILPKITKVEKNLLEAGAGYLDDEGNFHHKNEGMEYKSACGYEPSESAAADMIKWASLERKGAMVHCYLVARSITKYTGGKMKKEILEQQISRRIGLSEKTVRKYLMKAHSLKWVKIIRGKYWIQAHDKVCDMMGFNESIRVDLRNNGNDITRGSLRMFKSFCYAADVSRDLWGKSLLRQYLRNPFVKTDKKLSTELQETTSDKNGLRTKVTGERAIRLSADDLGYSLGTIYNYKKGAIELGFIKVVKQFCKEVDTKLITTKERLWAYLDTYNDGHRNFEFDKRHGIYRKRDCDLITAFIHVRKRRFKSEYCNGVYNYYNTVKNYNGTTPTE